PRHHRDLRSFPTRRSSDLPMIDLWPEEDSPTSKLGGLFDEAMRSRKTYQQVRNALLDRARALRARSQPVPNVLERLERNSALQIDRKSTRLNSSHLGISYA